MYFPKNRIKTGLKSNGELSYKKSGLPYYGNYFKTYNNKFYAGENPNYSNLVELVIGGGESEEGGDQVTEQEDFRFGTESNYQYSINQNINPDSPLPYPPKQFITTPNGYQGSIGEYPKYFAKKINAFEYLEISKETYNRLKSQDPTLLWTLYNCLYIPWSISSTLTNRNLAANIERDNKWFGFINWLNKYYFGPPPQNGEGGY